MDIRRDLVYKPVTVPAAVGSTLVLAQPGILQMFNRISGTALTHQMIVYDNVLAAGKVLWDGVARTGVPTFWLHLDVGCFVTMAGATPRAVVFLVAPFPRGWGRG